MQRARESGRSAAGRNVPRELGKRSQIPAARLGLVDILEQLNDAAFENYFAHRVEPFGLWRLCPVIQVSTQTPFGLLDAENHVDEAQTVPDAIAALHWFGLHRAGELLAAASVAYRALKVLEVEVDFDDDLIDVDAVYGDLDEQFMAAATAERINAAVLAKIAENPALFGLESAPADTGETFVPDTPWADVLDDDDDEDDEDDDGQGREPKDAPVFGNLRIPEITSTRQEHIDSWLFEFAPWEGHTDALVCVHAQKHYRSSDRVLTGTEVTMSYGRRGEREYTEHFEDATAEAEGVDAHSAPLWDLPPGIHDLLREVAEIELLEPSSQGFLRNELRRALANQLLLLDLLGEETFGPGQAATLFALDVLVRTASPIGEELIRSVAAACDDDLELRGHAINEGET